MSLHFYIHAKGEDLTCAPYSYGARLLDGMKCYDGNLPQGIICKYFYPEPAELRQRLADLAGPLTPVIAELRRRLEALEAPLPEIPAELRQHLEVLATELAPVIAELRERIAVLETSSAPIVAEQRGHTDDPVSFREIRSFVNCYEKAFVDKTEWEPVYRPVSEEDVLDDYIEGETDPALPPDADETSSSEDGEGPAGWDVEWGDPSLMEPKYEQVPGEMHREPYIVMC